MPPAVTGTIVALIGLNLAPAAKANFVAAPVTALITLVVIILVSVLFRGILGRLSILVGVVVGYLVALLRGEVDFTAMDKAAWIGLPQFQTPVFHVAVIGLFVPVVLVLVAENIGHVKSVALMTGKNLDPVAGRALLADGLATTLAGFGGGSGTTTYAENIGVMAATKVYSTAAYWVAALAALLLSFSPKFGALIATVPVGVLGGAATMLYGMIGVLGRAHLGAEPGQFLQPGQPHHRGRLTDHRHRGLHVERRLPAVCRHCTGDRRRAGDLPRHERAGPLARHCDGPAGAGPSGGSDARSRGLTPGKAAVHLGYRSRKMTGIYHCHLPGSVSFWTAARRTDSGPFSGVRR